MVRDQRRPSRFDGYAFTNFGVEHGLPHPTVCDLIETKGGELWIATRGTNVILTDIGLPGMSGIDGIRALRERLPDVPILALTVYDSDDQVFRALCAGASGYLLKNTPPARLLESLREVAAGGAPTRRLPPRSPRLCASG